MQRAERAISSLLRSLRATRNRQQVDLWRTSREVGILAAPRFPLVGAELELTRTLDEGCKVKM